MVQIHRIAMSQTEALTDEPAPTATFFSTDTIGDALVVFRDNEQTLKDKMGDFDAISSVAECLQEDHDAMAIGGLDDDATKTRATSSLRSLSQAFVSAANAGHARDGSSLDPTALVDPDMWEHLMAA